MTYEELKEEAKRQGYKLIKENPMPKLLPCPCGGQRRVHLRHGFPYGVRDHCYECIKCGRVSEWGKTEREAREEWNRMVENERVHRKD